jgi:hypothetical protein
LDIEYWIYREQSEANVICHYFALLTGKGQKLHIVRYFWCLTCCFLNKEGLLVKRELNGNYFICFTVHVEEFGYLNIRSGCDMETSDDQ